jgi:hypothetical protein
MHATKPPRRLSGGLFGYFLSQLQKVTSPDTVRIVNFNAELLTKLLKTLGVMGDDQLV